MKENRKGHVTSTKTTKLAVVDITILQGKYFERLKEEKTDVVDLTIEGKENFYQLQLQNYKLRGC